MKFSIGDKIRVYTTRDLHTDYEGVIVSGCLMPSGEVLYGVLFRGDSGYGRVTADIRLNDLREDQLERITP